MSRIVYRYTFADDVPGRDVEETLALAVLAAETLHGAARVRLDASYHLDPAHSVCVIDATTDTGQAVARLFTGLLTREFGERAFTVRRVTAATEPRPHEIPA